MLKHMGNLRLASCRDLTNLKENQWITVKSLLLMVKSCFWVNFQWLLDQIRLSHGEILLFLLVKSQSDIQVPSEIPHFSWVKSTSPGSFGGFCCSTATFHRWPWPVLNPRPRRRPRSGADLPGAALHRRGRCRWPSSCARFVQNPSRVYNLS